MREERFEYPSIVGTLINFRGMVYSPTNELGVVLLFGKILKDLNMYVEEIKAGYPDCVARRRTRKGWERIYIEFEFKSSTFKSHLDDYKHGKKSDLVVCWIHDWKECPVPVLELREEIKNFEPEPIGEEEIKRVESEYDLEHHIQRKRVLKEVKDVFIRLDDEILKLDRDEKVFHKYAKTAVTYYCPEKTFVYIHFHKTELVLHIYINKKKIIDVKSIKDHENWGEIRVKDVKDIPRVMKAVKQSFVAIREAIKTNTNTGWYAVTPKEKMHWLNTSEQDKVGQ